MPLGVGRFTLHQIRDCAFAVDGGVLFGPVPRTEWGKAYPPDADNRVALTNRCLLIECGDRRILVDAGMGEKLGPEEVGGGRVDRSRFDLDRELARAGTSREAITDVIISHLHRERAGGITRRRSDGRLELAFPRATFHLQRRQLRWAYQPSERDAACFCVDDFALLEETRRLHLCETEIELLEGLQIAVSEGHAVGQQLVVLQGEEGSVLCAGDLLPTAGHLKVNWSMAVDLHPLTGIEEKKMLLAQAVETGTVLFLTQEAGFAACRLREEDGGVVVSEIVEI